MGDAEIINELKRLSNVITSLDAMIAQQIITNTNLVNSVIELQASNVSLTNMIAQQVITNTNLANSITELQNQVALQTTTNVNLTNTITELQNQVAQQIITNTNLVNSIATLTVITGQLVTVNIRTLDETDVPHTALPYDTVVYNESQANVANNADVGLDFTAAGDWGAGNDWSTFALIIHFEDGANFMTLKTHSIEVSLLNLAGDYSFREVINPKDVHVYLFGGLYRMSITFFIPTGFQTGTAQTLRAFVRNQSGNNIGQIIAYIIGCPS